MNIISLGYASTLQKPQNLFTHKNLHEGNHVQVVDENSQFDKLELISHEASKSNLLNTPDKITTEKVSREKTIAIETLESRIKHIDASLEKADSLNLSYSERLEFLKNEGEKWVEDIKKNDPEMFIQWLKSNKENIMSGHSELASLPPDFTMKDYYSYVKEPFSALV
jgi:hypothetical protein